MRLLDQIRTVEALSSATGKWAIYASWALLEGQNPEELFSAAPWLQGCSMQIQVEEMVVALFDSEEEARAVYGSTVGDDGPTKTNPYHGDVRVYALLVSPEKGGTTENT